jgi:hypothetical protein
MQPLMDPQHVQRDFRRLGFRFRNKQKSPCSCYEPELISRSFNHEAGENNFSFLKKFCGKCLKEAGWRERAWVTVFFQR